MCTEVLKLQKGEEELAHTQAKNEWRMCSTQFGLLQGLALWEETVCTQTRTHTRPLCWSLPGRTPLVKAGAVGSTRPQAAASTQSERWVGWRSDGPWTHWHCSFYQFFSFFPAHSVTLRAYVCVHVLVEAQHSLNRSEIVDTQSRTYSDAGWICCKATECFWLMWHGGLPVSLCLTLESAVACYEYESARRRPGQLSEKSSSVECRSGRRWAKRSSVTFRDAWCLPLSCYTPDSPNRWLYSLPLDMEQF